MELTEVIKVLFSNDFDDDNGIFVAVLNESGSYIEENSECFIKSAIDVFVADNLELEYEYAEIKDMEYPELQKVNCDGGICFLEAKVSYILDLWNKETYIGHVNAVAIGEFSFVFNGFLSRDGELIPVGKIENHELKELTQSIDDFRIIRLENIEEYFDVYIE